jgi:hypothetical protein
MALERQREDLGFRSRNRGRYEYFREKTFVSRSNLIFHQAFDVQFKEIKVKFHMHHSSDSFFKGLPPCRLVSDTFQTGNKARNPKPEERTSFTTASYDLLYEETRQ